MSAIISDRARLLSRFPQMERTTFDVSLVHFLLMFGYKLFSLYYPLYLLSVGLSVISIGSIYFLTYAVISLSCVVINFFIHRVNPARLASLGVAGYGVFALLMLLSHNLAVFYLAQLILGFSAAAWLVSLKFILMNSKPKSQTSSFGWFYSMPDYATALAPALGGLIIWKWGFPGVFLVSVVIQLLNAVYAYVRLSRNPDVLASMARHGEREGVRQQLGRYKAVLHLLGERRQVFLMLGFIFLALGLGGIYRAFFALLLKDLSFSQPEVIRFTAAISFVYVPFSLLTIRLMGHLHKARIAAAGMAAEGLSAVLLGSSCLALSYGALFCLSILDSMGELAMGSGKSAFFAKKLDGFKEEASTIDSVMTTLAPALGGLVGGWAVAAWGYRPTFFLSGLLVMVAGLYSFSFRFAEKSGAALPGRN